MRLEDIIRPSWRNTNSIYWNPAQFRTSRTFTTIYGYFSSALWLCSDELRCNATTQAFGKMMRSRNMFYVAWDCHWPVIHWVTMLLAPWSRLIFLFADVINMSIDEGEWWIEGEWCLRKSGDARHNARMLDLVFCKVECPQLLPQAGGQINPSHQPQHSLCTSFEEIYCLRVCCSLTACLIPKPGIPGSNSWRSRSSALLRYPALWNIWLFVADFVNP